MLIVDVYIIGTFSYMVSIHQLSEPSYGPQSLRLSSRDDSCYFIRSRRDISFVCPNAQEFIVFSEIGPIALMML